MKFRGKNGTVWVGILVEYGKPVPTLCSGEIMAQYFGKTVTQGRLVGVAMRALFQVGRCRAIDVLMWRCIFAELWNLGSE